MVSLARGPLRPMLLVGVGYCVGAWFGITQAITQEGIAVLWPANAVLLSAFLLLPPRQWPLIALATFAAQCAAVLPAFPFAVTVAFWGVNLFETALAAWLIRRCVSEPFDFNRLYNGTCFLLFGPLLACAAAGLAGAVVYVLLERADTGFLGIWRIWWFGDALGLLVLTPLIITVWRHLEGRRQLTLSWSRRFEATMLGLVVLVLGVLVFMQGYSEAPQIYFTPIVLLPLGVWSAMRFGVLGAASTVALIAALAIGHLVQGIFPYPNVTPSQAVWLTQEYLAIVAVVSIGLAVLMREIAQQRLTLNEQDRRLQAQNVLLEERIAQRTADLARVNRNLREANARLEQLATTDHLTSFANRRHFEELGQRELQRLGRDDVVASVVMFDLDHFKSVNDRYGHDVGDEVLRRLSAPVSHSLRPRDLCGRSGGEEFVLLLADADEARAVQIAERIRRGIAALSIDHQGGSIRVSTSFGVAEWDRREDLGTLMSRADAALYRAKRTGRNRVAT